MKQHEKETLDLKIKEEKLLENSVPITLSRKMRWFVFAMIISLILSMSFDQGIFSSCTTQMAKDFGMTEMQLGGFGGMIFLGTAIGCVFSFSLINKYNRKYLLIITVSLDILGLFFITQTTNIFLLYMFRVVSGFSTSFLSIYSPVWSDQFGVHSKKSLMMSSIHISSSLGYMLGYGIAVFLSWENSLYFQNLLLIVQLIIVLVFLPNEYFSSTLIPLKGKAAMENSIEILKEEEKENKKNEEKEKENEKENLKEKEEKKENSKETEKENEKNEEKNEKEEEKKEEEYDDISLFEDIDENNEAERKKNTSMFVHAKILLKSPVFILINICLSSIFIIVSAIQFWINDYLEFALNVTNEKHRLLSFAIIIATSPIFGIFVGGALCQKIGGYETKNAIYIPLLSSLCVCILANIVPLTSNHIIFDIIFWIYLFFGSVILPVANGIVLCSVDKQYSGSASSVTTFIYNILGKLIGPNFYAWIKEIINDKSSKIPLWLTLNVAVIGFLSVLLCIKFQKKKYEMIQKEKLDDDSDDEKEKCEDVKNVIEVKVTKDMENDKNEKGENKEKSEEV